MAAPVEGLKRSGGSAEKDPSSRLSACAHPSTSCWPPSMSNVGPVTAVFVMSWTASAAMSSGPTTRTAVAVLGLAAAPAHANRCTGAKLNAIGKKESH